MRPQICRMIPDSMDCLPLSRSRNMYWTALRDKFPTLKHSAYFNYGAAGPLSEDALAAMFHAYEILETSGPFSVEATVWIEDELSQTRFLLEEELDAARGTVALVESVCAACNSVLWAIDWRPGDHIVLSKSENPGVTAAVRAFAQR